MKKPIGSLFRFAWICSLTALISLAAVGADKSALNDVAVRFDNPGSDFRGKPFWSWNGNLNRDELLRQVRVLKAMGMGGHFMHSRTGLKTEYLGEEWFRLINDCADESARLGLEAWLYDEDRWPSGTAGGLVTLNPKFRARFMSLNTVPAAQFTWNEQVFAAFACKLQGNRFTDCQRLQRNSTVAADRTVLVFSLEEMEKSTFFNGYTDVDRLNAEATQQFIKLTHEKYKVQCGKRLGQSIKGIFTDEPHRGSVFTGFSLDNTNKLRMTPWTEALPAKFQERFGYDLVEKLPELFLQKNGDPVAQVKWHYMELLQSLFLENFARPIHDWCQANNMQFTGHALHEDNLTSQAAMQGSLMRFYEYLHLPGVDVLTEGNRNYWVVKQLTSAARQLGKPWLLSELYGCTGWQFNFEGHKYVGDWQALFGINLRCHHLSWYTMEGEAKRDYPASIFFQSAWWKDYKFVEDYYSRLNVILTQGQPVCDVLVLNPVESVWCQIGVGWASGLSPKAKEIQALEKSYQKLFFWLTREHVDFDYGDEEMIGRLGKVGRDSTGQTVLQAGQAVYRTLVVGHMTTLRSSSLKLLKEFRHLGGQVIFAGPPPPHVDAVPSTAAAQLANFCTAVPWNEESFQTALRGASRIPVQIQEVTSGKSAGDIFCQLRVDRQNQYLVAMNMDRNKACNGVQVRVRSDRTSVAEWDCTSGVHYRVPATRTRDGYLEFATRFAPLGERVFVLSREPEENLAARPQFAETHRTNCAGPFSYTLNEPNVCVLDMARYQINEEPWEAETEILKVDRAVRTRLDLPFRSGKMIQPWFRKKTEPASPSKAAVRLNYGFEIEVIPEKGVELALEHPEQFEIMINGKPLQGKPSGWWVDPVFQTIAVPAKLLVRGANEIQLKTGFHGGVNLEAIYLLGSFGVRLKETQKIVTVLPAHLSASDITQQGLPFYGGAITYRIKIPARPAKAGSHAHLELPAFEAACAKYSPAGKSPRYIAWKPYEVELPETVGYRSTVDLEVILTRRNTFGPLHQVPLKAGAYGPGNWVTEGKGFASAYMLYPSGLLEAPVVSWRQDKAASARK